MVCGRARDCDEFEVGSDVSWGGDAPGAAGGGVGCHGDKGMVYEDEDEMFVLCPDVKIQDVVIRTKDTVF